MKSAIFKSPLPYLALFAAHLIWGMNFVVAKVTLGEFPIMGLAFLRMFLAILLLIPFFLTMPKQSRQIKSQDLPKFILAGLFMVAFSIAFFLEGLNRTTAINASVLNLTIPMLSLLVGWWFLREKIYLVNLLGVSLGLIGAIVIVGVPILFLAEGSSINLLGNLLIIISSISFVIGALFCKNLLKNYSPMLITMVSFAVGALVFFIPALLEFIQNPTWVSNVSILGILGLSYMVLLSSISAFFLLNWGLSKIELIQANLFQYMEPAIAATLAVPLLGERISYSFIIGTCLIVLGVYWGTLGKLEHHHLHFKTHRH